MDSGREGIEKRKSRLAEACRQAGVKVTPQRLEIFAEVARRDDHPDAAQVHGEVRKRMPSVSLDTVYRTLWMLDDLGLIRAMGPSRGKTRFDANLSRHHHFVCVRCGFTRDFHSDELDRLKLPETVASLGRVESSQIEVRGICRACAADEGAGT